MSKDDKTTDSLAVDSASTGYEVGSIPPMDGHSKDLIKEIAEYDAKALKHWKYKLEEAQKAVEYWEKQYGNSSSLNLRVSFHS